MAAKKATQIGTETTNVKTRVRQLVLHEAGYKVSNPRCHYSTQLDVHHLHYVSEGGSDDPANLLPLCPNCHQEHHNGKIPTESLRAWKMLLLAINEAFDRRSVDMLLSISMLKCIKRLSGDGVLQLAPLVASGLVELCEYDQYYKAGTSKPASTQQYWATLTDKGILLVEGWKRGDQDMAISGRKDNTKQSATATD